VLADVAVSGGRSGDGVPSRVPNLLQVSQIPVPPRILPLDCSTRVDDPRPWTNELVNEAVHDRCRRGPGSPLTSGLIPEPLGAKLFYGLVSGLQYLQERRIAHRDIKVGARLLGGLTW
jgi:serine/threonine protein kinase